MLPDPSSYPYGTKINHASLFSLYTSRLVTIIASFLHSSYHNLWTWTVLFPSFFWGKHGLSWSFVNTHVSKLYILVTVSSDQGCKWSNIIIHNFTPAYLDALNSTKCQLTFLVLPDSLHINALPDQCSSSLNTVTKYICMMRSSLSKQCSSISDQDSSISTIKYFMWTT